MNTRLIGMALAVTLLAACGGGGGGGGGGEVVTAPSISTQPTDQGMLVGQSAVFSVLAYGNPSPDYQWLRNGVPIVGADKATYTTPVITVADHLATYSVQVKNSAGQMLSSTAKLIVLSGFNSAESCLFTGTSSSTDPLLGYAWHIKNNNLYFASTNPALAAGLDLCMGSLWASGKGAGVKVNVVDEGLEIAHEDLSSNVIAGASWNFLTSTSNPTNSALDGDHGTSVAGLIVAVSGNAKGSAGVAPLSRLMGYNLIVKNETQNLSNYTASFGGDPNYGAATADIFNFSAGSGASFLYASSQAQDAIYNNIATLRSGKGGIFVKSAGNGFVSMKGSENRTFCNASGVSCQNANQDTTNTNYTAVVVAALGADGQKSSYSTTGSPIWISGFGGEYGFDSAFAPGRSAVDYKPALLTTDQTSCSSGYSRSGVTKNGLDQGNGTGVSNASCNYTAVFNGTSSAAPVVSGVVALMLEANPALTWRDVKHILASTARTVNPDSAAVTISRYFGGQSLVAEQGWVRNAANYYFHNWYGFGLVNAAAAVAMAKVHVAGSLGSYTSRTVSPAAIGTTLIPAENITGLSKDFSFSGGPATVEQAEMTLHFGSGFVPFCHQIELMSPAGTKSILLNMDTSYVSAETNGVRFLSNAFYGEPSAGTWSLKMINSCDATTPQTLSSTVAQQLTIRGR